MFTIFSLLLTSTYIILMSIFFSQWYLILIWFLSSVIVFYLISAIQIFISVYFIVPLGSYRKQFKYDYINSLAKWLIVFIFNVRVKFIGLENMPHEGKVTLYANHKSKLDPLYLYQAIGRPIGFAAKSDLKKIGIIDHLNRGMGTIYVYRNDNRATLKEVILGIKRAKEGHPYVIFPEGGTMYRDIPTIQHVKNGSFKIPLKAETDILPVTIHNSTYWRKRKCFFKPFTVTVELHPLIKYDDIKDLQTQQLSKIVIDQINSTIQKKY